MNFWTKNEDFEQCVYRAFAFFVHLSQYPKVLFLPKIQLDENTRKIVVNLTLFVKPKLTKLDKNWDGLAYCDLSLILCISS